MIVVTVLILSLTAGILLYGAYNDYKTRTIPNLVPLSLGIMGIAGAIWLPRSYILYVPILLRAAGCLIPAALSFIIAYKFNGAGGGDIKLMAAMGFLFGLYGLVPILAVTSVSAVIWAAATRQKSVPLAVFMLVGFIAYAMLIVCAYLLAK